MSIGPISRISTSYALAVRAPRCGLPELADGAWWIVAQSDDDTVLKTKARGMTDFLSGVKGDAIVLKVEFHSFTRRTKVTPMSKYIASGWSGVWMDNTVPGQLAPEGQENFEVGVQAFYDLRESATRAAHAERIRMRLETEGNRKRRHRHACLGALACVTVCLAAGMAWRSSLAGGKAVQVSEFERRGGMTVTMPDGKTGAYIKWRVAPDGTRTFVARGRKEDLE